MNSSPDPAPENQAEQIPAGQPSTDPQPGIPPQPRIQRVLYTLFSPETRTGRILRPVLRWAAAITGLFALGLLTAYLALYQPAVRQRDEALDQFSRAQTLIRTREAEVKGLTGERDALQKKLEQAQSDLAKAQARIDLLWVLDGVNNARVALVNKDGVAARTALDQAQADLARALPYIEKSDKSLAEVTKSRLELANKELVIDPQAAQTDLNKLHSDLVVLIHKLFP